jgi:acyl-CoA thioesterase-1
MAAERAPLLLALVLSACGGAAPPPPAPGGAAAAAAVPADAPLVAFLGDSIAAGLHLPRDEAFPAVLQRELAAAGVPFRLVNAGVSGDTTAGGRARVDWLLRQKPAVVVVELGANDGFRGIPAEVVEGNLREILLRVAGAGAKPLLLGMRLPPNYGPEYVRAFEGLYGRLAEETGCAFVPGFLDGVGGRPDRNLEDGIHPTAEGHRVLAANVAPALRKVLGGN